MKDTLPGVRTNVGQESIATFINTHVVCKFLCCDKKFGKYRSIVEREVIYGSNVLARNEQDVLWSLRVDVLKRYNILVLIGDFTGYRSGCNLAEQTVLNYHDNRFPPQYRSQLEWSRLLL